MPEEVGRAVYVVVDLRVGRRDEKCPGIAQWLEVWAVVGKLRVHPIQNVL
jgi:hypothetical protein